MLKVNEAGQVVVEDEGPLVIKILKLNKNLPDPKVSEEGDWIDLYASETKTMEANDCCYYPLGVLICLPAGCEGHLVVRSSTPKKFCIVQRNPVGVIDHKYKGRNKETGEWDEWRLNCKAERKTTIHEGDRIAQFRIELSQKATVEEKMNWLCHSGVKIEFIDSVDDEARGGFGSTGTR